MKEYNNAMTYIIPTSEQTTKILLICLQPVPDMQWSAHFQAQQY